MILFAFVGLLFALSIGAIGLATLYLGKIIQMALNTDDLTAAVAANTDAVTAATNEIASLKSGAGEATAQAAIDAATAQVTANNAALTTASQP